MEDSKIIFDIEQNPFENFDDEPIIIETENEEERDDEPAKKGKRLLQSKIDDEEEDEEEEEYEEDDDEEETKPQRKKKVESQEPEEEEETDEDDDDDEDEDLEKLNIRRSKAGIDKLCDHFGWNEQDVSEEARLKFAQRGIKGYHEFVAKIIEANSEQEFASTTASQLERWVRAGGKEEDFFEARMSYSPNALSNEQAIRKHLQAIGYSKEDIEEEIEEYADKGLIEKKGAKAKKYLTQIQQHQAQLSEKQILQEQQRRQQMEAEKSKATISKISDIIEKSGLKISGGTERAQKMAFDYIWKPGQNNMSKIIEDLQNPDNLAFIALIGSQFNYDVEKFAKAIKKKAKEEAEEEIFDSFIKPTKKKKDRKRGSETDFSKIFS